MKVSKTRTFVKSISWRIIGTGLTSLLFYIFTDSALNILVQFGIVDTVLKFITFYGHEIFWNRVEWGMENEDNKSK